jgi:ribonuclease BN (tRNA processing enzyme)
MPINVYGPPKTEDLVKAAVQYFTISADIRIADGGRTIPIGELFFGHDVGTGQIYKDPNVTVTAIENTHFDFQKVPASARQKSYSYRFDTFGRVIVFTGDTGPTDALVELAKGADLLCFGSKFDRTTDARLDQIRAMAGHDPRGTSPDQRTNGRRTSQHGRRWEDGDTRWCKDRGVDPSDMESR